MSERPLVVSSLAVLPLHFVVLLDGCIIDADRATAIPCMAAILGTNVEDYANNRCAVGFYWPFNWKMEHVYARNSIEAPQIDGADTEQKTELFTN